MSLFREWMKAKELWIPQRLFSIDVRSLALARAGVGTLLLVDLCFRAGEIAMFYVSSGVTPREGFIYGSWSWSLHTLIDNEWWVILVFAVHAFSAIALFVGFRTRTATIVAFLLTVSLQHSNMHIIFGGDAVLRLLLFAGMFLPWGRGYSYDAVRARNFAPTYALYSPWTVAIVIQFALLYVFAVLHKTGPEWMNGTAVYYAATSSRFATTWFSGIMTAFPELSPLFVSIVLFLQIIAPVMLFVPVFTIWVRSFAVLALLLMHIAFGLTLHIAWFSYAIAIALSLFIPSEVWNVFFIFLRRVGISRFISDEVVRSRVELRREHEHGINLQKIAAVIYLSCIVTWNLDNIVVTRTQNNAVFSHDDAFQKIMLAVGIDQHWSLFSPSPPTSQFWPVVQIRYADGRTADALRDYAPVDWTRPTDVYVVYKNLRHAYYLTAILTADRRMRLPEKAARYYCREAQRRKDDEILKVEIYDVRGVRYYTDPTAGPFYTNLIVSQDCRHL